MESVNLELKEVAVGPALEALAEALRKLSKKEL